MSSHSPYLDSNHPTAFEQGTDLMYAELDSGFYEHGLAISASELAPMPTPHQATDWPSAHSRNSSVFDVDYQPAFNSISEAPTLEFPHMPYYHSPHSGAAEYNTSPLLQQSEVSGIPTFSEQDPPHSPSGFPETTWSPQSAASVQSAPPALSTPPPKDNITSQAPHMQLTPSKNPRHNRHNASISSMHSMPTPPPHPHGASTPVRRPYAPIAPHPVGLRQLAKKRTLSCTLSDDEWEAAAVVAAVTGGSPPPTKRLRRSAPASPNIEMTEEDTFLLRLKDEEGLTWKEIATRFHTELGKSFQVPALQMRLKRLRERMRIWTEGDIQALRMAHEFWMSQKWDVIAGKMTEFGATEKWSPKQCSRKWQELSFAGDLFAQQMMRTPTFSTTYTASPIEGSLPSFYPALAITTS